MRAATLSALLLALAPRAASWVQWTHSHLGPGTRAGHSLMLYNDTLYVFGGRSAEASKLHDPRTFSTARSANGTVEFTAYNDRHVTACLDDFGALVENASDARYAACYSTRVGTYRNDLWAYPLNCSRKGDAACVSRAPNASDWTWGGWQPVLGGAPLGGCINYNETKVCTHPQERFDHVGAVVLEAKPVPAPGTGTLTRPPAHVLVYGGFSQLCGDYCSDMWEFPLDACAANAEACAWREVGVMGRRGPGARWRAAHAADGFRLVLFGGHRLWHGFAPENAAANDWDRVAPADSNAPPPPGAGSLPFGGFLDDLWVFTWDARGLWEAAYNGTTNAGYGRGSARGADPGAAKRELTLGAPVRPDACSRGANCSLAGAWTQVIPREACHVTPGLAFTARNDITCTVVWPPRRAHAALALREEDLFLHGGYAVAGFPYPHVLGRGYAAGTGAAAQDTPTTPGVLPYPAKPYFFRDLWRFSWTTGQWAELAPLGAAPAARRAHSLVVAAGRVLLLFGGYASNELLSDLWIYNVSTNRWLEKTMFPYPFFTPNCTTDGPASQSVLADPTRGRLTDGRFGRSPAPFFIPQQRRRALGWDGCRDRGDGRTDLGLTLSFLRPAQRAGHAAVWSSTHRMMLVFGGEALPREQLPTAALTWPTEIVGDTWTWQAGACPLNCSLNGDCAFGFCYCRNGYYGADCSNSSCPGTSCTYDEFTHDATCTHCCAAPYVHTDADVYVPNVRKARCDATHPGESNGVCDGYGKCLCAPPFLGVDCSIKNCRNDCTDPSRGTCILEYPVARCECEFPFTGDDCSQVSCLNNCSYPNGVCNTTTGECTCAVMMSPYNNTYPWLPFAGIDCSYVPAFAAAPPRAAVAAAAAAIALAAAVALARGGA